jgi:hypothetical protein
MSVPPRRGHDRPTLRRGHSSPCAWPEELQHVEPIQDSAWLTGEVVEAIGRLMDQHVIAPSLRLRETR